MRLLLALLLCFPCFAAQAWPDKPVRIVVAYPPGGGIDVMARQIAEKLTSQWGQSVVVENRPAPTPSSPPTRSRSRPPTATRC
jgi:tripartite-type tricarboxylate transporter receptor subunit TctC